MEAPPLARTREQAARRPDRVAVRGEHDALTYRELVAEAERLASALGARGGPVGLQLPSGPRLLAAFLGAVLAGRPACVLHTDFADRERDRGLAAAGVSDLLDDEGLTALAGDAAPGAPEPDPRFYIGFTSGTSGTPKPFTRRWGSWASSFAPSAELYGIGEDTLVALPGALQHSHFLFGAVLALEHGAEVRTWGRFDAPGLLAELAAAPRSVLFVVPTMLAALEPHLDGAGPLGGVGCVVVSGSAYDARHRAIARRAFPEARIVQIYGASELSFVTIAVDDGDREVGEDVGTAFPGVEIALRGDGPVGEIWVRSPYLFDGYLQEDGLDDLRDEDGFASVGDLGRWTAEGRLELVGRASNMLITGGKNVHPEEIEAVLRAHPGVRDCAVVGLPDPYWGERLEAVIEAEPGAAPVDDATLAGLVRAELAAYKVPKAWHRVRALPRTASGKIARARLPEHLADG